MLKINDVIKLQKNIQDNIRMGHLGTVVHIFDTSPPIYEIEFTDEHGNTLVTLPLREEDFSLHWSAHINN